MNLTRISVLLGLSLAISFAGCRRKPAAPKPEASSVQSSALEAAPTAASPGIPKAPVAAFATPESLAQYNVLLRDWVKRASYVPTDLAQLKTAVGAPPLPPAALGQRLVYDPKTITVSLQ